MLVLVALVVAVIGGSLGYASYRASVRLAEHGTEMLAFGFAQGRTAERARLRVAVEGGKFYFHPGSYGEGYADARAAVLALFDEPAAGGTHGEPYAFNCTVPGCTVEGHHR